MCGAPCEREREHNSPYVTPRQNERDGVGRRWRSASVLFIKHTSKNGVLKIAQEKSNENVFSAGKAPRVYFWELQRQVAGEKCTFTRKEIFPSVTHTHTRARC